MQLEDCKTGELSGFEDFAARPGSLTQKGIEIYQVSVKQFTNWRWQMAHQLRKIDDAPPKFRLSREELHGFRSSEELFHAGVTPYYLSLMSPNSSETCPIRRQVMPSPLESNDPEGEPDPLEEVGHSPVKEVVHVYPDRVAFCIAQLCPVYCRYCFRKRRDQEQGLHFNRSIISRGLDYIAANPAIRDVLVTGGDPFIANDSSLDDLLGRLRRIPHVEIIRIGTRTPVTLPYRITPKLAKIIAKYHPVWVNTHFNHPLELTQEARRSLQHLLAEGIPLGNQSVLLKGVNNNRDVLMKLSRELLKARVRPYYLFHPHRIAGTKHLRVSVQEGLNLVKAMRGNITGFGIPIYALDTPSGKVPLHHQHVLAQDGKDLIIENPRGEIWREPGVMEP